MRLVPALLVVLALASPAVAKPVLALSEIALADTSGTPAAAGNATWSRVKSLTATIAKGLGGSFEVKLVAKANCQDYGEACLAKWARGTGGNLILIGTVLKMTPKLSHFWVGIFKPDGKTRLFYRDIKIDGDSASDWTRAGTDLVSAVEAAGLGR